MLLKRWWWCGCKLFLEKFLKSWTTFLLRFLFLFYLCARMPAQVHRLENMYWLHQCCIITCVIVCMREKENREDEREHSSRHIITFISFLLHLVLYVTKPHISKLINNCVWCYRKCINQIQNGYKYRIIVLWSIVSYYV